MNPIFRLHLSECGSTNDAAWEVAPEKWPALISTDAQTKGRGRQGRAWVHAPGAQILASLVFKPRIVFPAELSWMPLAAGVAAMRALQGFWGRDRSGGMDSIWLKWPNDLYLGNGKLAGILCESRLQGSDLLGMVVGIGLNVTAAPALEGRPTAALSQILGELDALAFREHFLSAWAESLCEPLDAPGIREAWSRFARLESRPVFSVRGEAGLRHDVQALDLTEDGRLRVRVLSGSRAGSLACLHQADLL